MFFRYSPLVRPDHLLLRQNEHHHIQHDGLLRGNWEEAAGGCQNGTRWIYNVFHDCVDTPLKHAGFVIGLISLFLWLVPMFPQLYTNYKTKRCEGLSIFFVICWLCGDFCNMIGALMTHQQPLQQVIGVYYILQDGILLSQYAYYTKIYPNRVRNAQAGGATIVVPVLLFGVFGLFGGSGSENVAQTAHFLHNGRTLGAPPRPHDHGLMIPPIFENYADGVGYVIGIVAAIFYFAGRIPQIQKNYYRKSCEGLSMVMIYIIITGNLTYGLSVLLETTNWVYVIKHLPWLVSSLGCVFFDCFIVAQNFYYKRYSTDGALVDDSETLLVS